MKRDSYRDLHEALGAAEFARRCVAENRGAEKEQAREAYESGVAEIVVPALTRALEDAVGDLGARDVERIARDLMTRIEKNLDIDFDE